MQTVHVTDIKVVSLIVIRSEESSIQLNVIKCVDDMRELQSAFIPSI